VAINDVQIQANSRPGFSGSFMPGASTVASSRYAEPGALERIVEIKEIQDLWSFSCANVESDKVFVWRDPQGDLTFVATGEVERLEASGPLRFEQVECWSSQIFEQLGGVALELPCLVGGFAFSHSVPRYDSRWSRWNDGSFVLPARIVYRRRLSDGTMESGVITHRRRGAKGAPQSEGAAVIRGEDEGISRPLEMTAEKGAQSGFEDLVGHALRSIDSGELTKVVVARACTVEPAAGFQVDLEATLKSVCTGDDRSIGFALNQPQGGVFVGLSPEVLVRVEKGNLTTHAVAGTTARGASGDLDQELGKALMSSAKDLHEHELVVRGIERALTPICERLESESSPTVIKLATIQHLSTGIRAALHDGSGVLTAVSRLHPTPALCGSPDDAARDWLSNHESLDRGWYAGLVGWLSADGAGTFAVAIRSALLQDGEVCAFGGAGIVRGSNPTSEWRETELKIDAVARRIVTREVEL